MPQYLICAKRFTSIDKLSFDIGDLPSNDTPPNELEVRIPADSDRDARKKAKEIREKLDEKYNTEDSRKKGIKYYYKTGILRIIV